MKSDEESEKEMMGQLGSKESLAHLSVLLLARSSTIRRSEKCMGLPPVTSLYFRLANEEGLRLAFNYVKVQFCSSGSEKGTRGSFLTSLVHMPINSDSLL